MNIQEAIRSVIDRRDLSEQEMTDVMRSIMTGDTTPAQIGGFLIGLRCKGETVAEVAAAARVMRELAVRVDADGEHLVDTCGTGGDTSGTFNISTASALVVAAAGGRVAKHGNRSVSSASGSADVLEAAGVNLDLGPEAVAECIRECGVGFLFAPRHHGAMRHAIGPRREMAVRTIFNVLGPLTNPAGAPCQVLGVFDADWVEPLAEVLQRLGSEHVMVVHARDGLDEISVASETDVAELRDGQIRRYVLTPEQFGLQRSSLDSIRVDSPAASLAMIRGVLQGEPGPARDIVALNAGAAIYVAGLASDLAAGVARACEVLDAGLADSRLQQLVDVSRTLGGSDG